MLLRPFSQRFAHINMNPEQQYPRGFSFLDSDGDPPLTVCKADHTPHLYEPFLDTGLVLTKNTYPESTPNRVQVRAHRSMRAADSTTFR